VCGKDLLLQEETHVEGRHPALFLRPLSSPPSIGLINRERNGAPRVSGELSSKKGVQTLVHNEASEIPLSSGRNLDLALK
jgi:hypothetical protein